MVVAGGEVGHQRAEDVERGAVAGLDLALDVHLDLVHRDVPGALDHHLRAALLPAAGELAKDVELGKLGVVAGVGERAGPEAVAQAPGDVVLAHNVAEVVEGFVERVLLAVGHHPLGDERPAAADDARHPAHGQVEVLDHHAAVDGHVVHALLGLVLDHVEEVLRVMSSMSPPSSSSIW